MTTTNDTNSDSDNGCFLVVSWMRITVPIERARLRMGEFINDVKFQTFIVSLIAINGIMLGIATCDFVRDDRMNAQILETFDLVCLILFTIEIGMQFAYWGWKLFQSGWLVFDLVVISISWAFAHLNIIRAFRIFRALRLVTRIPTMKSLVLALFSVMPRMLSIGLLLFLISYIFAVMFTQLFKDLELEEPYFVRIDNTFFTLFQIMTLDNWAEIVRQVMEYYTWAWFPFITFVIISGFVVVNLIIAVICDAVAALHDDERAKIMGTTTTSAACVAVESSTDSDDDNSNHHITTGRAKSTGDHHHQTPTVENQLNALEQSVERLAQIQEQTARTMELFAKRMEFDKNYYAQLSMLKQSQASKGA